MKSESSSYSMEATLFFFFFFCTLSRNFSYIIFQQGVSSQEKGIYTCISKHLSNPSMSAKSVELIVKEKWENVYEEDPSVSLFSDQGFGLSYKNKKFILMILKFDLIIIELKKLMD